MVPITRSSSGITSNRPRVIVRKKKRQNPNYQPEVAQCLKESVHNAIISLRRACSASRREEFFSESGLPVFGVLGNTLTSTGTSLFNRPFRWRRALLEHEVWSLALRHLEAQVATHTLSP